ncbi:SDR family oxidoreductase [Deinococcus ruber]|uniref:NAD-dependent epimerase/dehydratase n=1 Tax=Deinococcus ruber TaxID=1848197 RepID=A0A918C9A1_9DEIO|nr:SDR family oxidoreductase [Deinococcus ruber]GGR13000.1 putative NAD-dependent epimerase/dehydratase [Deinococcus ruber]
MRVFVTGASGFIGSAVVPELLSAGHQVTGLARSDASAATLTAAGASILRGDLTDLASLRAGAAASDGVVHLAYNHDFSQMGVAAQMDRAALEAIGEALAGTNRPLVFASGVIGMAPGRLATERDSPPTGLHPRIATTQAALALASSGVRVVSLRFAPTVHGEGDHGFMRVLIDIARQKGVSGYVGDGENRWPAVHRLDAATLTRLALENGEAGSSLHAVAEEGVRIRDVAEVIGRHLNLPVVSVPAEQASEHFGWLGMFIGADSPVSSTLTREWTGWEPTHPGLIEDLNQGHYFRELP